MRWTSSASARPYPTLLASGPPRWALRPGSSKAQACRSRSRASAAMPSCSRRWRPGNVDVGLGSGPGLGFRAKGAPAIGVAAMYGPPANLALVLPFASPIRTLADLKGKRIGVTTAGSLTDWLVRELSRQRGWGSDGIQIVALGQMQARLAAIQRGELDGMVIEAATGYELEEAGKAKNFMLFGDIAKDFYTHVIFATDDLIEKRPTC